MRLTPREDTYLSDLVRRKARTMAHRCEFRGMDLADIQQALTLEILRRFEHFDPRRASAITFMANIIDSVVVSLLRAQRALKRGNGQDFVPFDECVDHLPDPIDSIRDFELRNDLEAVIAQMPPDLQVICRQLMTRSMSEVARRTGQSRAALYARRSKILQYMEDAGLRAYL